MATKNHIATLGWERLHHLQHSLDIAPSDFHLFPALKKNLAGRHFGSNAEVKQAVKGYFRMKSPETFLEGLLNGLVSKWTCSQTLEVSSVKLIATEDELCRGKHVKFVEVQSPPVGVVCNFSKFRCELSLRYMNVPQNPSPIAFMFLLMT
ncbi:histone-lysine N-methyltransferase SETMAR [Trichonephila clavipes]|nr:histone-lysine N-methyltransferase SETMAR [Trichonephila clavipes]